MDELQKHICQNPPKVGSARFIAIDGHGGSGKSTLATRLADLFNAEVIHTDDFAGWDNPENWWPLVIKRVFEPIKNGATKLNYPRSKWWETHNPEPIVDQLRPEEMLALIGENKRAAIIANAKDSKPADSRAERVQQEIESLAALGLQPAELDLRDYFGKTTELSEVLKNFGYIWVMAVMYSYSEKHSSKADLIT